MIHLTGNKKSRSWKKSITKADCASRCTVHQVLVLLALASTLITSGCESAGSRLVREGVYSDRYGRFTVKVPRFTEGLRIDGKLNASGGSVQFTDDFGSLRRIDVVPADSPSAPVALAENRKKVVQVVKLASPTAILVHEDSFRNEGRLLDFYLFEAPGSGVLYDAVSQSRTDVYRACLAFVEGNIVYTITTNQRIRKPDQKPDIKGMKSELLATMRSMTFPVTE